MNRLLHNALLVAAIVFLSAATLTLWNLHVAIRQSAVAVEIASSDAHNLAVAAQAAVGNLSVDAGSLLVDARGRLNGVATDVERNLNVSYASQNELRHLIGNPGHRDGMFMTQDRLNSILGDPRKRDGFFATQDKFNVLFGDAQQRTGFFATQDRINNVLGDATGRTGFIASMDRLNLLLVHADDLMTGPVFNRFYSGVADLAVNGGNIADDVRVWTKRTLNPGPYTGNHPRAHKIGVGIRTTLNVVNTVASPAANAVRTANGGK